MMALRHGISRLNHGLGAAGFVQAMLAGTVILVGTVILADSAHAGPIFFPGELRDGKFVREGAEKPAGKAPDARAPDVKAPDVKAPAAAGPADAKPAVGRAPVAATRAKEPERAAEMHCL